MRKLTNPELSRLTVDEFRISSKKPVILVLDNVRSCHNIGSVFRTCDAFRIEKIILCGITATPPNKEIHKSALGAENSVIWEYTENTVTAIGRLKEEGYLVYAVEQVEKSVPLSLFQPPVKKKTALVFGNEIRGIQQEVVDVCDGAVEIPQFGTKHSFNISVSVGIVLWEVLSKLEKNNPF